MSEKLKINVASIFNKLIKDTRQNIQKEKEYIKTVKESSCKISEDIHGGGEATKDIKHSPSNATNGEQNKNAKMSEGAGKNIKMKNEIEGRGKERKNNKNNKGEENNNENGSNSDRKSVHLGSKNNKATLKIDIEKLNVILNKKKFSFNKQCENDDTLCIKVFTVIKQCLKKQKSFGKAEGYSFYDKNVISNDILMRRRYKIPHDKYDYEEPKNALFFLDTSGSLQSIYPHLLKVFDMLIKQNYKIIVAGCGNGFLNKDADDDQYGVKETLLKIKKVSLAKVVRPCEKTAANMANKADISFIVADFDGLSSIVRMAQNCEKGKIPYFLSTEDRYSWECPTDHDWVNPDYNIYPNNNRVFDISIDGNPSKDDYNNYINDQEEL